MSQASDVEALLLRLLESEEDSALRVATAKAAFTVTATPSAPLEEGSSSAEGPPAATPLSSQHSEHPSQHVITSLSSGSAETERAALRPSAGNSTTVLLTPTAETEMDAATPVRKRSRADNTHARTTTAGVAGVQSHVSSASASTRSSTAAGRTENGEQSTQQIADLPDALSAPASASTSQPALSLTHPVVEFLATVQLQGYAAHIIDDLGLRSMPALLAYVSSEAVVGHLLGPYASLQQQSELWRGLRRWEKEEARRSRAAAEERRRQQLAEARAERQKEKQERQQASRHVSKACETGRRKRASEGEGEAEQGESRRSSTGHQLPLTVFTQLRNDGCFSLPSLFDKPPEEVTISSSSLFSATETPALVATELISGATPSRTLGGGESALHSFSSTVAPPSASTSCVSLTTSATQLMRKLSFRRTHTRRHGRDAWSSSGRSFGGSGDGGGGGGGVATQSEPIDVDAEEADATEETTTDNNRGELAANAIPLNVVSTPAVELGWGGNGEESRTPSASQQSSESHLSSLLCSLREAHADMQGEQADADDFDAVGGQGEEMRNPESRDESWSTACNAPARTATSSNTVAEKTSSEFLVEGSVGSSFVVSNKLVASRHVSLGALSAHAELNQLPPPPLVPLPTRITETAPARRAEEAEKADVLSNDDDGMENDLPACRDSLQSCKAADHYAVERTSGNEVCSSLSCHAAAQSESVDERGSVALSDQLAAARERLEQSIQEALERYNAEIATVHVRRAERQLPSTNVVERSRQTLEEEELDNYAVACRAVVQPLRGANSESLVQWDFSTEDLPERVNSTPSIAQPLRIQFNYSGENECEEESTDLIASAPPLPASQGESSNSQHVSSHATLASPQRFEQERHTTGSDVVLSALTSTDVSATTTARPTALPHDARTLLARDDATESMNLLGSEEFSARCERDGPSQTHTAESQSSSVAELTAGTQTLRQHIPSCEEKLSTPAALPDEEEDVLPSMLTHDLIAENTRTRHELQRNSTQNLGLLGDAVCRDADDGVSRGSVWMEEEEEDEAQCDDASSGAASSSARGAEALHENEEAKERGSSQEWWDSFGIDALNYTQNCMEDDTSTLSQQNERPLRGHQRSDQNESDAWGQRGTSPGAKPVRSDHASSFGYSPVPREVVEVESSSSSSSSNNRAESDDEADDSGVECTQPIRSPAPETERRGDYQPVETHHRNDGATGSPAPQTRQREDLPLLSRTGLMSTADARLEPSAWRRMTNAQLRQLCAELGVAVPAPSVHNAGNTSKSSSRSPPPPQRSLSLSKERLGCRSKTPEDASLCGAADVTGTTCRELFLETTEDLPSQLEAETPQFDRRATLMERESLLEALRLLAVRLRFRNVVAPFFLHRVPHFSGLVYKRVRAADLIDEGAILTRDDLQRARQRYKAEEQAETERCVLAALAADAAEAVEAYAAYTATRTVLPDSSNPADTCSVSCPLPTHACTSPTAVTSPPATSCYDQMLLREPVNVEAATVAVQRCFPHVAHTRVQQLLTANQVIAEAVTVVAASSRSPSPAPPSLAPPQSSLCANDEMSYRAGTGLAKSKSPSTSGLPVSSQNAADSSEAPVLSQEAQQRANTRRYFAQRGYMTRRGAWGRGGRGGGRGGRRGGRG